MSEADLQRACIDLIRWLGLLYFHDNDSRRNQSGFPDLVISGQGGHLFRELKAERGRLRPEQADWIARLRQGGADAGVWRPADLASGLVQRELTAITGRAQRQPMPPAEQGLSGLAEAFLLPRPARPTTEGGQP